MFALVRSEIVGWYEEGEEGEGEVDYHDDEKGCGRSPANCSMF